MQGDSKVAAAVGHTMQTKVITHICYLARLVHCLGYDLHWFLLLVVFWESISSLGQIAAEYLHQAVRLSVVVNG
jgi:hypothetical protein